LPSRRFEKTGGQQKRQLPQSHRSGIPARCALFSGVKNPLLQRNLFPGHALTIRIGGIVAMLVERGLRVMSVEVVGDAYAIASNYLRRTGAISDNFVTDDRLLQIIVALFQRGEVNKIRLANKAITQFESEFV
jgi:hypothetical protein